MKCQQTTQMAIPQRTSNPSTESREQSQNLKLRPTAFCSVRAIVYTFGEPELVCGPGVAILAPGRLACAKPHYSADWSSIASLRAEVRVPVSRPDRSGRETAAEA